MKIEIIADDVLEGLFSIKVNGEIESECLGTDEIAEAVNDILSNYEKGLID